MITATWFGQPFRIEFFEKRRFLAVGRLQQIAGFHWKSLKECRLCTLRKCPRPKLAYRLTIRNPPQFLWPHLKSLFGERLAKQSLLDRFTRYGAPCTPVNLFHSPMSSGT